jgi:hypothetical protein
MRRREEIFYRSEPFSADDFGKIRRHDRRHGFAQRRTVQDLAHRALRVGLYRERRNFEPRGYCQPRKALTFEAGIVAVENVGIQPV